MGAGAQRRPTLTGADTGTGTTGGAGGGGGGGGSSMRGASLDRTNRVISANPSPELRKYVCFDLFLVLVEV